MSTLRAAEGYVCRGFAVLPIPHRKKGPIMKGWEDLRLTVEELPQHFNGRPQNVGLILGEPSGGLVDVDLDAEEAAKVAGRFLPPTLTSGRESSPHSHWWYVSPDVETIKFKDVDRRMLVELRSTGCQTIVDPSVHPSGELVVWHDTGPEPAEVEAEELERCVRELATATLIARHLPPIGGRHDFVLALAGVLLRPERFDEASTLKVLKAAWDAKGYPDEKSKREAHRDLEAIIRDTSEKLAASDPAVGGPTLEESAPGVVELLRKWWGWARGVHVPPTTLEPLPWPELSAEALHGLPGDVVRAIEPHNEADSVALLANTLCAFGNVIGRGAFVWVGRMSTTRSSSSGWSERPPRAGRASPGGRCGTSCVQSTQVGRRRTAGSVVSPAARA
jgi:Bifunctional DNA primase/polymerase, N-terminal